MKKIFVVTLLAIVLLSLTGVVLWAAPLNNGDGLAFEGISLDPEVPYPGQSVVVTVAYTNTGDSVVPEGTEVTYQVEAQGVEEIIDGDGNFTLEADVPGGEGGEATFEFYAPVDEKTYSLTIDLEGGGGEASFGPQPMVVESALPDALGQLFAGLGVFAAVMAIMAVGTEVVIESFKFVLGLKAKVTALEALEQLKSELPGQLTGLGVAPELQGDIDKLLEEVKVTLEPIEEMTEEVAKVISSGSFGDTYEAIQSLEKGVAGLKAEIEAKKAEVDSAADGAPKKAAQQELTTLTKRAEDELGKLKKAAVEAVEKGFKLLLDHLPLGKDVANPIREKIVGWINDVTLDDVVTLTDRVFKQFQEMIADNGPQLTSDWLHTQINTYLTQGREGVDKALEVAVGTLRDLGLPAESVQAMEEELDKRVDSVERVARDRNNVYSLSVKNLLEAVEERRNDMQSPARKIWRRLRESQQPLAFVLGVALAVIAAVIFWVATWSLRENAAIAIVEIIRVAALLGSVRKLIAVLALVGGLLAGAVVGAVMWLFAALIASWVAKVVLRDQIPGKKIVVDDKPAPGSLGYFLHYRIEKWFNSLRGEKRPPEEYGDVDVEAQEQIEDVGPTTLAKVLLQREDKHRDQETSRIRILRVFSIIVGAALAYWLQIDAAEYLNYAVPGITGKINVVDLGAWPLLPDGFTVGMALTGLAASAGSKFWRDLLGRLQTARGQAEEAAKLVRKVKGMVGTEEG